MGMLCQDCSCFLHGVAHPVGGRISSFRYAGIRHLILLGIPLLNLSAARRPSLVATCLPQALMNFPRKSAKQTTRQNPCFWHTPCMHHIFTEICHLSVRDSSRSVAVPSCFVVRRVTILCCARAAAAVSWENPADSPWRFRAGFVRFPISQSYAFYQRSIRIRASPHFSPRPCPHMSAAEVFARYRDLQRYVGWTERDAANVRSVAESRRSRLARARSTISTPSCSSTPEAMRVITGGTAQIERLKDSLRRWLSDSLRAEYDRDYVARRWNIGLRHAEIGLHPGVH